MNSWVLRIAQQDRECDSCWDRIYAGSRYFLTAAGERFCRDCEPDSEVCP
jgi:hypothetical protein